MSEVSFEGVPGILQGIDDTAKIRLREVVSRIPVEKRCSVPPDINFSKEVVFIEEGWLCLSIAGKNVTVFQAGETLFNPGLSPGLESQAELTLTAATRAVVITVPKAKLIEALAHSPEVLFELYERATRRNIRMLVRMAQQQTDPLDFRLASILWGLSVPRPDGNRSVPPINQTILASCLGTGREEISRKRQLLMQQGTLFRSQGVWVISAEVGKNLVARGLGE